MDFRLLRYFIATIEEGSVQGAARRMNIAQPALSRRIRDLELSLDCQLLTRGPRGVTATRAGEAFYRDAVAMVKQMERTILDVRRLDLDRGRDVRLGIVHTARKYAFVQEAVAAYGARSGLPGIAFHRALSNELVEALREDQLDVTLVYERRVGSPRLDERLIHRESYLLAAHRSHPLAIEQAASLADIAGHRLIWLARQSENGEQDVLMQQCRRHGLEPRIAHLARSHEEQIDLAMVSGGICLTPASTMLATAPGQFVFRPIRDFPMTIDLTLGWQKGSANSAVASLLEDLHGVIDAHQRTLADGDNGRYRLNGLPTIQV